MQVISSSTSSSCTVQCVKQRPRWLVAAAALMLVCGCVAVMAVRLCSLEMQLEELTKQSSGQIPAECPLQAGCPLLQPLI